MSQCPRCGATIEPPGGPCPSCTADSLAAVAGPLLPQGYRLLRPLGAGGMGVVYLVEELVLGRPVALKRLSSRLAGDPVARARFLQEARSAAGLEHPHVVRVYSFGEDADGAYLVMEYVGGGTLGEALGRDGVWDPARALRLLRQLASGLQAAAERGVVHRDVKPSNILLDAAGDAKLADFGLARVEQPLRPGGLPVERAGTPQYLAPERLLGDLGDARGDVYALGLVLFEVLTGRPAIAPGCWEPAERRLPPLPAALPRALRMLIERMTHADPAQRPAYAEILQLAALPPRVEEVRSGARLAGALAGVGAIALAVLLLSRPLREAPAASPPAPARGRTLAVLPFRAAAADAESADLGFSLADAIVTKLTYLRDLNVRPMSSARRASQDPLEAGRTLQVDALVVGSMVRDGAALRVQVQLIDVAADRVLWGGSLDLDSASLRSVQDRVASEVVRGLRLQLSPNEERSLRRDVPADPLAYEYLLKGVARLEAGDDVGVALVRQSLELDPSYAPAWARLGGGLVNRATKKFGGRADYQRAKEALDRGLALNPELVEAQVMLGVLWTETGEAEQGAKILRALTARYPSLAIAHWNLSYAYRYGGLIAESIVAGERALELDPALPESWAFNAYLYAGEYRRFLASVPRTDDAYFVFYRGLAHLYLGEPEQARSFLARAQQIDPEGLFPQIGYAVERALAADPARGLEILDRCSSRVLERDIADGETLFKLGEAYAVLGKPALAAELLERSVGAGFFCSPWLERDPLLSPAVRAQPAFVRALALARARSQRFRESLASAVPPA